MMRFPRPLRRFLRREDGTATVEFAILVVPMFTMLISAVELGMIHIHHSMLERAVDLTVRDIRLGTGTAPQHDEIKAIVCERAGFIDDCANNLRLEMIQLDPRNWAAVSSDADCTDTSEPVKPVRRFEHGSDNELMFLRACAKFDPAFPTIGMGEKLVLAGDGKYALISSSVFVQEPR
jgi:Flp pilus assembly pilin Flp